MSDEGARRWLSKTWVQCLLLYIGVAGFYVYNASPQPGYVDSGMVAANVYSMRVSSWVNVHLLHNIVGRVWMFVFPFGEIGWRLIILGGLISAGAIVNLYRLLIAFGISVRSSLLAAIGTALAHAIWWHAVTVEVYGINAFFTPLICLQVLRFERDNDIRFYYRAAFYYGLAAVNHILMGLFVFAFIASVLNKRGAKEVLQPVVALKTLGWFVLGWQPALLILFTDIVNAANRGAFVGADGAVHLPFGDALSTVLHNWSGGDFKKQMFVEEGSFGGVGKWLRGGGIALVVDFPNALLLLAPVGIVAAWRRPEFRISVMFILGGFLVNFVWVLFYAVWDQWAFAVPSYMLWGFFAGVGLQWLDDGLLAKARGKLRTALVTTTALSFLIGPWWYVQIESWAREPGFWNRYFSFFDGYMESFRASDYFASPFKRNWDQPRRYAERMWEIVPEGGAVYDDHGSTFFLMHLYYNACLGKRRDISNWNVGLAGEWIPEVAPHGERLVEDLAAGTPVFLTSLYEFPGRGLMAYTAARLTEGGERGVGILASKPVDEVLSLVPQLKVEPIVMFEGEPFMVYRVSLRPQHLLARLRYEDTQMALKEAPSSGVLQAVNDAGASGGTLGRWEGAEAGASLELLFSLQAPTHMGLRLGVPVAPPAATRFVLDGTYEGQWNAAGFVDFGDREYADGMHEIRVESGGGGPLLYDYLELRPIGMPAW